VRRLRAWWYRSDDDGTYFAECVDLDLLTQGASPEEAITKLQQQTVSYLEIAFSGKIEGLVLRKSPLSHRIRYRMHCMKERIRGLITGRHRHLRPCSPIQGSCS
jgi:predicted RNase H-like HicB family nuclease